MSDETGRVNLATANEFQATISWLQEEITRLRLTDAEREAVHQAAIRFDGLCQMYAKDRAATLRGLLERMK